MRERIENIQALRGLAALLVLIAHLGGAERVYTSGRVLPDFLDLGVTGVDLFFLISGYVMVHVTAALPAGGRAAGRFLAQRAGRIYPLYWIVSAGFAALYAVKVAIGGDPPPDFSPAASVLLYPDPRLPFLTVGWTLVHELYFYLVFTLIVFAGRARLPLALGLWALIVAIGAGAEWRNAGALPALIFSPLTFEFIAGCLVALAISRGARAFAGLALLGGAALLASSTLFYDALWPARIESHLARTLVFTLPYALILYGAVAIERRDGRSAPKALRHLGDASYALYLVHLPVVLTLGVAISAALGAGTLPSLLLVALGGGGAILVALVVHRWMEAPLLAVSRRVIDRLFPRAPAPEPHVAEVTPPP